MPRNRFKAAVAAAVAAAITLSACTAGGAADGANGGPAGTPSEPVTITYTNFTSNAGNQENLARIIEAFEAENPDIRVEVRTMPFAEYFIALQTDLVAGTEADVFDVTMARLKSLVESDVLLPLETDTSVFQESLAEAFAIDGVQYGLPTSFSTVVLFYNEDLFEANGLETPQRDWTWDDVQAAAEAITDQDAGVWGILQPITFNGFVKALAQAGGQFLSDDGTSVAFDTPEGIAAARWLTEKSGTVMPTEAQGYGTPDFELNMFHEGNVGMWVVGIWMFHLLADADFSWNIAVEPGLTQQASAMFANAVGISRNTEHPEEALRFAEFLSSSQTTVDVRLEANWELPTVADETALAPFLEMDNPSNRQAVLDSLDQVVTLPVIGDGQEQMQDIVTEELREAAARRKTVEEAVASAAQRVNAILGG